MSKSPILFSSDDEDEGSNQEIEVLRKFQIMLQGVPPPSSVTMSKLSVSEMLQKYKENENSCGVASKAPNVPQRFSYKNLTPLVYYLNSSQTSEEIANLSQKVQSRYIYSETMSSCNIWFDTIVKTSSAKKQSGHRNGFGMSPGSRLSHLACRRQIFSCENLQQLANSERRRHVEIKKESALRTRTLERNKSVDLEKINSFKRALFLSPDNEDPKNKIFSSTAIKRNLFPSSDKATEESSRAVGHSRQFNNTHLGGSSKKRKRTESRDSNGHWPRRALTFTEDDSSKCQETNLRNAKVISELQLSLHHKSKLLWAVSVTLKERNMTSKDPQFKTCASALFMICRKNLGKILNSKKEGGTSEKMLHFAREQIGGIFKKLGINSYINLEQTANNNSANSSLPSKDTCPEQFTECSDKCKETSCTTPKDNTLNNSESPLNIHTSDEVTEGSEIPMGISEKENIDFSGSSTSFC